MNQSMEISINDDNDESLHEEIEDKGSSSHESRTPSEEEALIGKQETAVVTRLRLVLLCVLAGSAVGVASIVYTYLKQSEVSAFHAQFKDDSEKILQTAGNAIDSVLGAFDSAAVTWVSYARATNQTWPFVTLPDFAVRMSKIVPLSRTIIMNVVPIVTAAQRREWEAYVTRNDGWVNETIDVQRDYKNYNGPDDYHTTSYPILHDDFNDIPYNVT
jgi:hypothetical protein